MKTKALFILLCTMLFVACKQETMQVEQAKITKYKYLKKSSSPYVDWYLKNDESIILYSFVEYPHDKQKSPILAYERNTEDNTISLNNGEVLRLHDSYTFDSTNHNSALHIRREVTFMEQTTSYDIDITDTASVLPIEIIRPNSNECNCIPMCYYDQMEVEWNADPENHNGMVIVAEWSGVTMTDLYRDSHIAIMDIVDDNGVTTLNNDIFNGMPDEALVNLWFIRGNVVELYYDGEVTLPEFLELANDDPDAARVFLEENPEFLMALQSMSVGHGSVALLPIYLIRTINL